MRTALITFALALAACGGGGGSDSDAGGTADAIDMSDAGDGGGEVLPTAPVTWERVVHMTSADSNGGRDPELHHILAVPSGVLVVSTPALVLYDRDGDEVGRTAMPDWDGATWRPLTSVAVDDATIAVLFRSFDLRSIGLYRTSDLQLERRIVIDRTFVLMASTNNTLFAVSFDDQKLELHEIGPTAVQTHDVAAPEDVFLDTSMVGTGDGHLLACATGATSELIALDIDTAAKSATALALPMLGGEARGCTVDLVSSDVWFRWLEGATQPVAAAALYAGDDRSLVAGPGYRAGPAYTLTGVGFDGSQYIEMDRTGILLPREPSALSSIAAYRMDIPLDATVGFYGAGFDGAGTHSYAAIGYAIGFGPVVQVLQRLPPLP